MKYVLNECHLQLFVDYECTYNRDTRIKRNRKTERQRDEETHREPGLQDSETWRHRDTQTLGYKNSKTEREKEREKRRERERERENEKERERRTHTHTHKVNTHTSKRAHDCAHT